MPPPQRNMDIDGTLQITRPWADWVFLRQARNVAGGGGFHIHNPWGDTTVGQGDVSRCRLEVAYRPGIRGTAGHPKTLWAQLVLHGPTGNVGIGTPDPKARLHVAGDLVVDGDIQLSGADCAEEFNLSPAHAAPPGTVMVLSTNGDLEPSRAAYDRRVAGVVSGAGEHRAGVILDRRRPAGQQERVAVALVGKVACLVDARAGAVEAGDLLTTSATPGHAMVARDRDSAFGAVLGKALQPLTHGRQLLSVLVNLQ